jgi:hypothetical protein
MLGDATMKRRRQLLAACCLARVRTDRAERARFIATPATKITR